MHIIIFVIMLDAPMSRTMITAIFSSFLRYRWNYSGLSLDKRLDFFESNWPFFAGFGKNFIRRDILILLYFIRNLSNELIFLLIKCRNYVFKEARVFWPYPFTLPLSAMGLWLCCIH